VCACDTREVDTKEHCAEHQRQAFTDVNYLNDPTHNAPVTGHLPVPDSTKREREREVARECLWVGVCVCVWCGVCGGAVCVCVCVCLCLCVRVLQEKTQVQTRCK